MTRIGGCRTITVFMTVLSSLYSAVSADFVPYYSCDFIDDFCNWNQTQTKRFKRETFTMTPGTGPSVGHTTGNPDDDFIYIDANHSQSYAEIESPILSLECRHMCFRFWYHMHGKYINKTEIGIMGNFNISIWHKSGNQNNSWHCGHIDLDSFPCTGKRIYIRAYDSYGGLQGDIAFDDLAMFSGVTCDESVCSASSEVETTTKQEITSNDAGMPDMSTQAVSTVANVKVPPPENSSGTSPFVYLTLLLVPVVILFVGIFCVYKRKRTKPSLRRQNSASERYAQDPTRPLPSPPEEESVYDTIPERPEVDYITPVDVDAKEVHDDYYLHATESSNDRQSPSGGDYLHPPGSIDHGQWNTKDNHKVADSVNDETVFQNSSYSAGSMNSMYRTDLSNLQRHLPTVAQENDYDDDYLSPSITKPSGPELLGKNGSEELKRNESSDLPRESFCFEDYERVGSKLDGDKTNEQEQMFDYERPISVKKTSDSETASKDSNDKDGKVRYSSTSL